jgi:hypothetical protein
MVIEPSTQELLLTVIILRIRVGDITMTPQAQLMKDKYNHLMFMWQLATKSTLLGTGRDKHT